MKMLLKSSVMFQNFVPGGFGSRGIDGKIDPFLSNMQEKTIFHSLVFALACSYQLLNLQEMLLDFSDAHSIELNPATTHPVISLMPDQEGINRYRWNFKTWFLSMSLGYRKS